jgi:hypothetical protein
LPEQLALQCKEVRQQTKNAVTQLKQRTAEAGFSEQLVEERDDEVRLNPLLAAESN